MNNTGLNFTTKMWNHLVQLIAHHSGFIIGIVINICIIYAFCKFVDLFTTKLDNKLRQKNSNSPLLNLMPITSKIIKFLVIFMLLAGFLQSFGYNVSSLIAGFGITGLAVGFAAKEAIGNVFGSISLLADKVYKLGEYISVNGYEGFVENINFRSTTIRTMNGFPVNIPNNLLANEEITNISQVDKRRIDLSIDIEYGTSNEKIDRAIDILNDMAKNDDRILDGAIAFIDNMAPSSIVIRFYAQTNVTNYFEYLLYKSDLIKEIIHKYREEGIEFAFPSTSVYMATHKNNNEN